MVKVINANPGQVWLVVGGPLTNAALLMVPASCGCAKTVGRLLAQAKPAGITVYLIGKRGEARYLTALAHAARAGSAVLAIDNENVLYPAYHAAGLTLLLVNSEGTVVAVPRPRASFRLQAWLRP